MIDISLLERVKISMRIDGEDHDIELSDLIETAKKHLNEAGVVESKLIDTDPLIRQAVITYCKGHFGTDAKDGEKFAWSFEEIKKHISLLQSYTSEVV